MFQKILKILSKNSIAFSDNFLGTIRYPNFNDFIRVGVLKYLTTLFNASGIEIAKKFMRPISANKQK